MTELGEEEPGGGLAEAEAARVPDPAAPGDAHAPAAPPDRPPVDYDPPWREARRRVAAAWARGGTAIRVVLVLAVALAVALLGAFLFGLWHVVVGGFLKGNWDAGGFGIALASVAGVLLWIEAAIARRLLPAVDREP
jgi:hypothetical protein